MVRDEPAWSTEQKRLAAALLAGMPVHLAGTTIVALGFQENSTLASPLLFCSLSGGCYGVRPRLCSSGQACSSVVAMTTLTTLLRRFEQKCFAHEDGAKCAVGLMVGVPWSLSPLHGRIGVGGLHVMHVLGMFSRTNETRRLLSETARCGHPCRCTASRALRRRPHGMDKYPGSTVCFKIVCF